MSSSYVAIMGSVRSESLPAKFTLQQKEMIKNSLFYILLQRFKVGLVKKRDVNVNEQERDE